MPLGTQVGFRPTTTIDRSQTGLERTRVAVARAKEGDRDALRYLYVRYSGNVYGYVRSIVGHDDAEDITQHVFAKLMTALEHYDERGVPFFAWLLRLARNAAVDHLRQRLPTPSDSVFDRGLCDGVDMDRPHVLRAALATLTDDQRKVMIMQHVFGLTPAEIARRMGRTRGSVHALHHRGRRVLQRELARLDATPFTRGPRERLAA